MPAYLRGEACRRPTRRRPANLCLSATQELPKRKVAVTQERSKVIQETENPFEDDEEEEAERRAARDGHAHAGSSSSGGGTWAPQIGPAMDRDGPLKPSDGPRWGSSSKKKSKDKSSSSSKSKGRKPFNLEAEKEKMKSVIAESSIASTNLMNALQSINRERERISDNQVAVHHFEACKQLRRRILRYVSDSPGTKKCCRTSKRASLTEGTMQIHQVESEQWLGSLLHANDELVRALMSFEQMDQSIDADSDSDDELAEQAHMYRSELPCPPCPRRHKAFAIQN